MRRDGEDGHGGGSYLFNFIMISGVLAVIYGVSGALMVPRSPANGKKVKDEGG